MDNSIKIELGLSSGSDDEGVKQVEEDTPGIYSP